MRSSFKAENSRQIQGMLVSLSYTLKVNFHCYVSKKENEKVHPLLLESFLSASITGLGLSHSPSQTQCGLKILPKITML